MPRSRAAGATPSDSTSARAWFVRPRTKPSGSSSQRQSRPKPPGACAMRPINSGRHGSSKQQAWSAATAERSPSRISAIDAAAIAGGSPTRGISSGGPGRARPWAAPRPRADRAVARAPQRPPRPRPPPRHGRRRSGRARAHRALGSRLPGVPRSQVLTPQARPLARFPPRQVDCRSPPPRTQATPRPPAPAAGRARAANGRRAGHRDAPARHREQREPARRAHRRERRQREPRAWKARSKADSERGRDRARLPGRSECR